MIVDDEVADDGLMCSLEFYVKSMVPQIDLFDFRFFMF
jgi:hypothetical protein